MTGEWKWYRENGKLWQVGNFKDNVKDGKWERYYPSGKLFDVGYFTKGRSRVSGLR